MHIVFSKLQFHSLHQQCFQQRFALPNHSQHFEFLSATNYQSFLARISANSFVSSNMSFGLAEM